MKPGYSIIAAKLEHLAALSKIELAAATMLRGHAPASVLEESTPLAEFRRAQIEGRLWVAVFGEIPVGFALVEMLAEDCPHLQEMDVTPAHGRRGLGTALLQTVLGWLVRTGQKRITLTTFRNVPWNMPFYAQQGFIEIPTHDLRTELKSVIQNEVGRGLDRDQRVVMEYRVNAGGQPFRA